jgi:hypothetical protein
MRCGAGRARGAGKPRERLRGASCAGVPGGGRTGRRFRRKLAEWCLLGPQRWRPAAPAPGRRSARGLLLRAHPLSVWAGDGAVADDPGAAARRALPRVAAWAGSPCVGSERAGSGQVRGPRGRAAQASAAACLQLAPPQKALHHSQSCANGFVQGSTCEQGRQVACHQLLAPGRGGRALPTDRAQRLGLRTRARARARTAPCSEVPATLDRALTRHWHPVELNCPASGVPAARLPAPSPPPRCRRPPASSATVGSVRRIKFKFWAGASGDEAFTGWAGPSKEKRRICNRFLEGVFVNRSELNVKQRLQSCKRLPDAPPRRLAPSPAAASRARRGRRGPWSPGAVSLRRRPPAAASRATRHACAVP